MNICRMTGLKESYSAAVKDIQGEKYPFMFLDLSQKGQLSPYRLFTDIFGRFQIGYDLLGMKAYIVNSVDFENVFKVQELPNKEYKATVREVRPNLTENVEREGVKKITDKPTEVCSEAECENESKNNPEETETEEPGRNSEEDSVTEEKPRQLDTFRSGYKMS